MLHSPRTRLTVWYIIIVAIVSISFSAIIYRDVTAELQRGFEIAELRMTGRPLLIPPRANNLEILSDEFESAKNSVLIKLIIVNGVIIVSSGIAAYFLADKTLKPIEEAAEKQKRFIADASHELRTPLTALRSEIEVALRSKKITPKESKDLLKSNFEEVEKMQKLTSYLLSLSRYESNEKKLTKQMVSIGEIIKNVIDQYEDKAKIKEIKINDNLDNVNAKVNSTSLEELISILLDNAIKYTPKKGKISISLNELRNNFEIKIKDSGVGIKSSEIPYIFNRFYRADTSRSKEKIDGFGLGLSIAKSIIDLYDGEIKAESVPDKGTTFTVTLPK